MRLDLALHHEGFVSLRIFMRSSQKFPLTLAGQSDILAKIERTPLSWSCEADKGACNVQAGFATEAHASLLPQQGGFFCAIRRLISSQAQEERA